MKLSHLIRFSVLAAVLFFFQSCKKEKIDTDTQAAVDNSYFETEFMRLGVEVNSWAENQSGIYKTTAALCPVITADTSARKMTIDYGTGCVDSIDNKVRKGQIKISFNDYWRNIGAKATVSFVNYFVNEIQYDGKVTVTHADTSVLKEIVSGGTCTNTAFSLLWESERVITINNNNTDTTEYDDSYTITGTATGTDRKSRKYSVVITKELVKEAKCPWISSGVLSVSPEGLSARTFDFGDGICDEKAKLTIEENSFTILMK